MSQSAGSVLPLFEQTGAYLRGHFRLTSGLHSGEYLQCARVLRYPLYAERLGRDLARRLRELAAEAPQLVVSPAMGGIIIGYEVARALGTPFLFTEREAGKMTLRRGFAVDPGTAVMIVEDVITTGGSTREVAELLQTAGARVVAAGSIIDRSGGTAALSVPYASLEGMQVVSWPPDDCPLCRQGLPLEKPGSRAVPAA